MQPFRLCPFRLPRLRPILLSGLLPLALVSVPAAHAQDWAKAALAQSPRHGEFVTIHEPGGRNLQAWVVYPEVKEKAPVIVMIHEIFGLTDWAREMADEVAAAGYIVVEPDLLSGFGPPASSAVTGIGAKQMDTLVAHTSFQITAATLQGSDGQPVLATEDDLRSLNEALRQHGLAGMGCDPMACAPSQKPTLQQVALQQPQQGTPMNSMDHMHMQQPGTPSNPGAFMVPATPGGTSAFGGDDNARKAVAVLDTGMVTADLDAAADYGKHLPSANGKLYVAGFCWGGGKSFLYATHRHDLSAAFVFYGPPPPAEQMKSISAPVYGFYAGNDARITATVPQTVLDMKAAGKTYDPVTYDGAGHGFMRAGEAPDASAANSAARQAGFHKLIGKLGGLR